MTLPQNQQELMAARDRNRAEEVCADHVWVSFTLWGDDLDVMDLTDRIGVRPSRGQERGGTQIWGIDKQDRLVTRPRTHPKPWATGQWELRVSGDRDEGTLGTPETLMTALLDAIEPARNTIIGIASSQTLCAKFELGFHENGACRPATVWSFSPGTLRRIAAFDATLDFAVFPVDGEVNGA